MTNNIDIERERLLEHKNEVKQQHERFCNHWCTQHDTECPYYDRDQESYDYEKCFRERD
jgi:hypothetical protein